MPLEIPTSNTLSSYSQRTAIGGTEYILRFQYNQRIAQWYLSVYDQSDSPIALGMRLTVNFPLMRQIQDLRKPPGLVAVIDSTDPLGDLNLARNAGLADMGDRHLLLYFDETEVADASVFT